MALRLEDMVHHADSDSRSLFLLPLHYDLGMQERNGLGFTIEICLERHLPNQPVSVPVGFLFSLLY